ncbi:unnamed protein product [Protopolystoma xenopodis]|uniref:Uncharacterized protein n=1 Tax=Protopolystoma xenopodis TaxID=117903 RepID=A0A3S5B977_9PLAT|nr:unnamed protein product [Protopolystoma xenopodis]
MPSSISESVPSILAPPSLTVSTISSASIISAFSVTTSNSLKSQEPSRSLNSGTLSEPPEAHSTFKKAHSDSHQIVFADLSEGEVDMEVDEPNTCPSDVPLPYLPCHQRPSHVVSLNPNLVSRRLLPYKHFKSGTQALGSVKAAPLKARIRRVTCLLSPRSVRFPHTRSQSARLSPPAISSDHITQPFLESDAPSDIIESKPISMASSVLVSLSPSVSTLSGSTAPPVIRSTARSRSPFIGLKVSDLGQIAETAKKQLDITCNLEQSQLAPESSRQRRPLDELNPNLGMLLFVYKLNLI